MTEQITAIGGHNLNKGDLIKVGDCVLKITAVNSTTCLTARRFRWYDFVWLKIYGLFKRACEYFYK